MKLPRAALIAVGTELLADGRVDTNGMTIARLLAEHGIESGLRIQVPDDEAEIAHAVLAAVDRFELVLITGGLGPTQDDVTREAVGGAFHLPLREDRAVLDSLRRRYESRGRVFSAHSARQALFPEGAIVLPNPLGTAPGLILSRPGGRTVVILPGVPHEMEAMLRAEVLPRLAGGWSPIGRGVLKITGLTEVEVQERLEGLDDTITILASPLEISLIVRGPDQAGIDRVIREARRRLGDQVFTDIADEGLETVTGRLLSDRGLTLATAESCTGGLLATMITSVPGASSWYLQGWVTYSNEAKITQLGVDGSVLDREGAVSEASSRMMALGARERAGSSLAASITGIAGPEGGTAAKPVGLVYIGLAQGEECSVSRHLFPGDRQAIRLFSARMALARIRRLLLEGGRP